MKTAVVNMPAKLGNVGENRKTAEEYVKEASGKGARLIVFPEFFLTGFSLNPSLYQAIADSDNIEEVIDSWAEKYQIAIGGSYMKYDCAEKQVYNTYGLFFPEGEQFFHRKDIPTALENFCYTKGDKNQVFETPLGRIGVCMCWEQIRYNTVRRMAGKVDLVIAGSCWWGFTEEDGEQVYPGLEQENRRLAEEAPLKLAEILGVPVLHAGHTGRFEGLAMGSTEISCVRKTNELTVVVNANGSILAGPKKEAGCLYVNIKASCGRESVAIPAKEYWIPQMPLLLEKGYYALNQKYAEYYQKVSLPAIQKLCQAQKR